MIKNLKDKQRNMTELELREYLESSPISAYEIEKQIVEDAGAIHITTVNGTDGMYPDNKHLEAKSQSYFGNSALCGLATYGAISKSIYEKKLISNEETRVIGLDAFTGEVYYLFKFNFEAISNEYLKMHEKRGKGASADINYMHYNNHKTFEVLYIAEAEVLEENAFKFTSAFYAFLMNIHKQRVFVMLSKLNVA